MLAIVIPFYKITYFEETLQALVNQTDKRFKVYIGDDASSQDPCVLLQKFDGQFDVVYHRFSNNLGRQSLVQQWYRCIKLIENENWIHLLGDDDVLSETFVAAFYQNLTTITKHQVSVVRYATQVIDKNGLPLSAIYKHPPLETAVDFLLRKFKGGTRSSLSEYIFERKQLMAFPIKDFPLAWSSDLLAVIECANQQPILTINEVLVFFRWSGENITSQADSAEKNQGWFMFYSYLLNQYAQNYPKKLINQLFDRLEKTQLNQKKTPKRWLHIFLLYLKFFKFKRMFFIFFKVVKSIQ